MCQIIFATLSVFFNDTRSYSWWRNGENRAYHPFWPIPLRIETHHFHIFLANPLEYLENIFGCEFLTNIIFEFLVFPFSNDFHRILFVNFCRTDSTTTNYFIISAYLQFSCSITELVICLPSLLVILDGQDFIYIILKIFVRSIWRYETFRTFITNTIQNLSYNIKEHRVKYRFSENYMSEMTWAKYVFLFASNTGSVMFKNSHTRIK